MRASVEWVSHGQSRGISARPPLASDGCAHRRSSTLVVIVRRWSRGGQPRIVEASTIFRVGWQRRATGVRSVCADLLDRDAELDALERGLSAIGSGAGRVVVVGGPAGIGKSSLLGARRALRPARAG